MKRLIGVFVVFAAIVTLVWVLWGGGFERHFSFPTTVEWLQARPAWGGLAGMGLLVSDLLLPIPGTVVMSALGYVYGALVGGCLATLGALGAGVAGYVVGRLFPERVAKRWLGEADFVRARNLFATGGGWVIALSRALPVLPEALACTAGLVRMPVRRFLTAQACGALPVSFIFAAIGAAGHDAPASAFVLSLVLPAVLWLVARPFLKRPTA